MTKQHQGEGFGKASPARRARPAGGAGYPPEPEYGKPGGHRPPLPAEVELVKQYAQDARAHPMVTLLSVVSPVLRRKPRSGRVPGGAFGRVLKNSRKRQFQGYPGSLLLARRQKSAQCRAVGVGNGREFGGRRQTVGLRRTAVEDDRHQQQTQQPGRTATHNKSR